MTTIYGEGNPKRRFRVMVQVRDPAIAASMRRNYGTDKEIYTYAYSAEQARRNIMARLGNDVIITGVSEWPTMVPVATVYLSTEEFEKPSRGIVAAKRYAASLGATRKKVGDYAWADRKGNFIRFKSMPVGSPFCIVYNSILKGLQSIEVKEAE